MLAADDAALAARETGLPGLKLALDGDAVADAVAAALPALGVTGATATYVRLKPGTSCLVGYRLTLAGAGSVDAYVRTHPDADDPKLAKILREAARRARGRPAAALLPAATAVVVHPHDHDLPALVPLADPTLRAGLLARALDRAPVDGWTLSPLRYKPERRWVAVLGDPAGRRMLLKVQRAGDSRRAVAGARAFGAAGVPAAALLGVSRRHGLTVHEWVTGTCAAERLAAAEVPAVRTARDIGALLAHLHLATMRAGHTVTSAGGAETRALTAAVGALAALDPAAGRRAARIAADLQDLDSSTGRGHPRLVHGDCSIDQVILTPGGPVLIDLDRAGLGDPHSDLAQLLADLSTRAVTEGLRGSGDLAEAVLDGYTAAGGTVDRSRLAPLTAARLIRLAPEPFRRRRDGWRRQLEAIIERAACAVREEVPA